MCLSCSQKNKNVSAKYQCMHMYNELVAIDLEILKRYSETKEQIYLTANKQVRGWISSLRTKCPDENDVNIIRELLNEHTI